MKSNPAIFEDDTKVKDYVDKVNEQSENVVKRIEEINQEIQKLIPIDDTALNSEGTKNISHYHRFITILTEEKIKLNRIRNKKEDMEAKINDYYRFHWDKSTKLSETAITKYCAAHPCVMAINRLTKDQESLISYLEAIITNIHSKGFVIKNLIELKKIELGLM